MSTIDDRNAQTRRLLTWAATRKPATYWLAQNLVERLVPLLIAEGFVPKAYRLGDQDESRLRFITGYRDTITASIPLLAQLKGFEPLCQGSAIKNNMSLDSAF